jgi:hypothetical protein
MSDDAYHRVETWKLRKERMAFRMCGQRGGKMDVFKFVAILNRI